MTPSQYPQEGNIRLGAEPSNHDKGGYSRDSQCEQRLPRRIFPSPVVFCHAPTPNSPVSHHARSVQYVCLEMQSTSEIFEMNRFLALYLTTA
jgi:hypothetical protein